MEHLNVFGLKVSSFELKEIDEFFYSTIHNKNGIVLFGHSLGYITLFKKYPGLYEIINSFDLLVCDGTQFNWYCYLNGFKLKTVISIPNITNYTLEYANTNSLSVLLFGAKEEINKKAIENLQKKYPNIKMLPGINGYYKQTEEKEIVARIKNQKPHILLIGISTPIKEKFVHTYRAELSSNIIIPCGGMIDVYSGYAKQSPPWVKKMGFATPFRIIQEPRRLFIPHTRMILEIFLKILPITFFNRVVLQKKNFNIVFKYLNK